MSELTEKRTPELIGAEIRMYVDTGRRISLLCGIEIGRRLVEAKEMLNHGEWLPWLERETEFSDRSAARYMKLFDEYGASQQGLFGPETNSPTLSNLPISKAFALLSVPESDRIEFAEEVDAEHISVRELEEKIRERERELDAIRKDMDGERNALADEKKQREQAEDLLKTQDQMLAEAKAQIAELAKLNKELENRPHEVAVETVRDEEAIAAAAKEAREKAEAEAVKQQNKMEREHDKNLKELHQKLADAKEKLEKAEKEAKGAGEGAAEKVRAAQKEAEALRAQLEEARKQLKASDSDVTAFGIRFNSMQSEFGYLIAEYRKVEARDPETAEKLHEAVRQLLEYFQRELDRKEDGQSV